MKRAAGGLTLIEVLAALALLGFLAVALSSWLQVTGAFVNAAAATVPWEAGAEQVMQRVQEDLLVGDFAQDRKDVKEPRFAVVDGTLTIRTRDPRRGPLMHEYRFESSEGTLDRITRAESPPSKDAETRLLVGEVAAWTCELDPETRLLTISLTSTTGRVICRSFACPP
jgi:prepilin-type N-terminal cleavage/methylation domain-containing protein